jgi:hypothetical protein
MHMMRWKHGLPEGDGVALGGVDVTVDVSLVIGGVVTTGGCGLDEHAASARIPREVAIERTSMRRS